MASTVSHPILEDAAQGRVKVVGLTVEQYDSLIERGELPEDPTTELIDGLIVQKDRSKAGEDPMTVGNLHAWVITQLAKLTSLVQAQGASIRIQLPIKIPPRHEPEPDAAIVRQDANDYLDAHPLPADIYSIVEVADSSLEYDRLTKYAVYADAGIACYAIINLPQRKIEVFTKPAVGRGNYTIREEVQIGGILRLQAGGGRVIELPAERLIPVA
jgi:Uma2 family endonuclease